jgi:predicted amidohydrolase
MISVAQTTPIRGDVDANLAQHLRLIRLAADAGAAIVVFPELSLTGYELDLAVSLAFSEHDPRFTPLIDAVVSASITVIAGAPVRVDGRLHIVAMILSPGGSRLLYTKRYLGAFGESARRDGTVPLPESAVFLPGNSDPLIPLDQGHAALAICADAGHPSHARRAADRGASAYLAGMFVIPSEFDRDAERLGGYARKYGMIVAMANFGSASGGLRSAVRSSIWSADGSLIVRLPESGAGVGVVRPTSGGWHGEAVMLDEE